jgi:hypothetical protein
MPSRLANIDLFAQPSQLGSAEIFDFAQAPCVRFCLRTGLLASTFACTSDSVRHDFGPVRQVLPASASEFAEPTIYVK